MSQFPKDRRETWITGIGIVSSLGEGLEAAWEALHPSHVNVDQKTYAPQSRMPKSRGFPSL